MMSEMTTGTAEAAESTGSADTGTTDTGSEARVSTNAVAASVLDDLEADHDDATDGDATAGAEPAPAAQTTDATKKELSVVDQLLHDAGYDNDKRPDGREWRIPRSRVRVMLERGLEKHRAADAQKVTALETERNTLRQQAEELYALAELVQSGPEAFLGRIAEHDERYRPFLTPAQAAAMQAQIDAMPEPDYPLPDGTRTFSMTGIREQLIPWIVQQAKAEAKKEAEATLKPLTEREKRIEAERKAEVENNAVRERTGKLLSDAQQWPLFGKLAADGTYTPFQQEVLDALRADKSPGTPAEALYRAYQKVALPRLMEDDNKKRERLLKEIGSSPKSPTVGRSQDGVPRAAGPATTRDNAAQAYAELERASAQK